MAFVVFYRAKNRRVGWCKAAAPSVQTDCPLDPAAGGHRRAAATSPAGADTHFKIMSGRNSLWLSGCQINRNKLLWNALWWNRHSKTTVHIPALGIIRSSERTHSWVCFYPKGLMHVAIEKDPASGKHSYSGVTWTWVWFLAQAFEGRWTMHRNYLHAVHLHKSTGKLTECTILRPEGSLTLPFL